MTDEEYIQTMNEFEKQQKENESLVFKELRQFLSKYKTDKLIEYMSETEYWNLEIVDTHGEVKLQKEPYWFKQVYIFQTCGYFGDDYSGTIWIPLPNGKYLKFLFSC